MENLKNIQPVEDFNWDAFEQGETYTEVSKDDLVKTYDETLNTVKDKEVVMGTVTSMNKREVVVNIGFKSDGVVPMSEFRYNPDLKIGDEVEVYLESKENRKGQGGEEADAVSELSCALCSTPHWRLWYFL